MAPPAAHSFLLLLLLSFLLVPPSCVGMYEEQSPQMELQSAVVVNQLTLSQQTEALKELLNTTREKCTCCHHEALNKATGVLSELKDVLTLLAKKSEGTRCPYPYTQVVDECFHAHTKKLTWPQARHVCQGMGGDLAEPKHLYALQTYLAQTYGPGYFWVGGTDADTEGRWHWVSGRPLDPVDWLFSRPDNLGGDEHCLEIVMSDYPKLFNDETCSIAQRFICQFRG
ncbi:perlucin-like [Penaeus japonicus]|uniref:perlucin-like n=1 Tax=Penaeus japonicus TaxID=27405 RepID=UPI001C7110D1|nr:perlucin-like [Penaeus japonicus]